MSKKLFFSLQGVDINDDDALAAFAQRVWEQATNAFSEEQDSEEAESDNDSGGADE